MAEEPVSSSSATAATASLAEGHIFQIRDLILQDSAALEQWSQIKNELAPTKIERSLIDRQLKEGDFSGAVLRTLQSWRSHEGSKAIAIKGKLCDVFEKYELQSLSGELARMTLNGNGSMPPSFETRRPLWFGMTDVVANFVGREAELHQVHRLLHASSGRRGPRMGLIHGEHGVGKTELARKYAHEHRAFYDDNVIWIEADSLDNVLTALTNLIRQQGHQQIPNSSKVTAACTAEEVQLHLDNVLESMARVPVSKCLFIFNNYQIEDPVFNLVEYLSHRRRTKEVVTLSVLFTSHSSSVDEFDHCDAVPELVLANLRPRESMQMMLDALNPANSFELEACEQITAKLRHLPLALQQAIAFIKDSMTSAPKEYGDSLIYVYLLKLQDMEARFIEFIESGGPIWWTTQIAMDEIKTRAGWKCGSGQGHFESGTGIQTSKSKQCQSRSRMD